MRVLIVGCGYVGLPLGVELARQGHQVFGLRRSGTEELTAAGITPLQADIARRESLSKLPRTFDWVVNCAASSGGTADDYRRLYLDGNRNLVTWLADSPPLKFIYTSSTSVYGQNDGSIVTEKSPAHPDAETAKILREAEDLLLAAAKDGFPALVLRVAGIYGPGRGHAFKQFQRGEAQIEGDGSRYLNMVHRDDLIGAIIVALERGHPGEIYNVSDNEPVTQLTFLAWLAAELNRPMPPSAPADVEVVRKRGATSKRVSNAKLRTVLGYNLKHPDFRSGYTPLCAEVKRD